VSPIFAGRDPAERARAQRERILRAARRYFDSKSAIVRAIIDLQMGEARELLDSLSSSDDLVGAILDHFERWSRPGSEETSAALFLEMAAEATRDPEIAAATQNADREIRARLQAALMRTAAAGTPAAEPEAASRRALALQCVIEGLLVRAVRQPDLDRRTLKACLDEALSGLALP